MDRPLDAFSGSPAFFRRATGDGPDSGKIAALGRSSGKDTAEFSLKKEARTTGPFSQTQLPAVGGEDGAVPDEIPFRNVQKNREARDIPVR
jgi:hypothetical protein